MSARAPFTSPYSVVATNDNAPGVASRFEFLSVGSLVECVKPIDWLVHGYFEHDSMAVIYGEPGHGKSFVAIDIACSVATATEWHGRPVKRGAVFYIAGEGHNGLARRFSAWGEARGVSLANAPLYVSNRSAALIEGASAKTVSATVRQLAAATGETPSLIVVDTLARNFGAGDENSTADMVAFVANLDNELRHPWKATVAIVHHSGKDASKGARGSSALRGAVDAEYEITRDESGTIRMQSHKMKEAEKPEPLAFILQRVELRLRDDEHNPVCTAVLKSVDYDTPKTGKMGRGKNQMEMLRVLQAMECGNEPVDMKTWEDKVKLGGMPRQRRHDAKASLVSQGLIELLPNGRVRSRG